MSDKAGKVVLDIDPQAVADLENSGQLSYTSTSSAGQDSLEYGKSSAKIDVATEAVSSNAPSVNDPEDGVQHVHVFQDPKFAKYYHDLYQRTNYEGKDHFDPELEWTPQEERVLVWKTDWYVCFWAFIMFLALDIDRYNLANAVSDNLLDDLHLTTSDYNLGNTINLVCFLSAELPSQLISKKVGPDRWIPTQMILWSVVAITQCVIKNRGGFLVTRALLGLLEGGFIPDVVLWMSYFYKNGEMSTRIGYFYIANPLTQAISALIAYGIFHIKSSNNWEGWRWLFLIEGLLTLVIGFIAIFKMPPSATQTKKWYRKKGWYTHRQEKIMVNRILRDDPTKGDMHNREAISFKTLWLSITDYDLWPVYANRLLIDIVAVPLSNYLPLLLKSMGFKTLTVNLLMIPPQAITIVTMMLQAHSSKFFNEFGYHLFISGLWLVPIVGAMHWWDGFLDQKWPSYVVLILALGAPPSWVLTVSWCSQNAGSVRTRTVSSSLVNICSQLASIVGANIFRPDDAPKYRRGTGQIFGIAVGASVSVLLTKYYYVWRNKVREKEWSQMTYDEQLEYVKTTSDTGNRKLSYRFST